MTTHRCAATVLLLLATCSLWAPSPAMGGYTVSGVCFCVGGPHWLPECWCWHEGWGRDAQPHQQQHRLGSGWSDGEAEPQVITCHVASPAVVWQTDSAHTSRQRRWAKWRWDCICGRRDCPAYPKMSRPLQAQLCSTSHGEADQLFASLVSAGLPWLVAVGRGLSSPRCPCICATLQSGSTGALTPALLSSSAGCWTAGIAKPLPAFFLDATKAPRCPVILVSMYLLDSRREDLLHDSRNCVAAFHDRHTKFSTK